MVRNDFVSNSSSSSFMILNPVFLSTKIDNRFFNILSHIPFSEKRSYENGDICFYSMQPHFNEDVLEIIDKIKNKYSIEIDTMDDIPGWFSLKNGPALHEMSNADIEEFKIIMRNCDHINVNIGLDDCNEKDGIFHTMSALLQYCYSAELDSEEKYIEHISDYLN